MGDPLQSAPRIVVVGGANTDVLGFSNEELVARDSNPGHVRVSSGGVGRNIAENLARLGARVELITAFGGDHNAVQLAEECRAAGVGLDYSLIVPSLPGSLYLAIMDEGGDMALALSDMRPLDGLTPDALAQCAAAFESADLVVADANLPAASLLWLSENTIAPLVVDPVSVAKAERVVPVLARLSAVVPNALEAGVLLGREVRNRDQAEVAARDLVALGVRAAFVTCGSFGVAWADGTESGRVPAPAVPHVVNATGAGDAFAAGAAFALVQGWSTARAARLATAVAAVALTSERTVSDQVSPQLVTSWVSASTEGSNA